MENVRIGIVGIGNMGSAHMACISEGRIKGLVLGALCDSDPSRLALCEERCPDVPRFSDYHEMIRSGLIDAILIAVPHRLHAQIAIEALENGLHTLTEKPGDVTITAVKKLIEVAKGTDKVFGIMFNQRTNPLFAKAREIVKSGQLGELKRSVWIITNWYRSQHYYDSGSWRATWAGEGGGVLLNQAPHNLDLWQWICGMPVQMTAFCDIAKYHHIEVEDDATLMVRYENGATGLFITTTGECPGTNRLEISGTLGKLVLENGLLKWWKLNRSEREICVTDTANSPKFDGEIIEITPDHKETAHAGILQNFTNAILHGEELLAPGPDALYELTLSNAAYLSQWTGNKPVAIPFDSAEFDALLAEYAAKSAYDPEKEQDTENSTGYSHRWQVNW